MVVLFRVDTASVQALDFNFPTFDIHACQVVGGLHQAFNVRAHPVDAHWTSLKREKQGILVLFAHDVARKVNRIPLDHQIGVCGAMLCSQALCGLGQGLCERVQVTFRANDHRSGFSWDGISKPASFDLGDAQVHVVQCFKHDAVAQFVGVCQSLVNVHSTVATGCTTHHDFKGHVAFIHGGLLRVGASRSEVDASCASDADFIVVLGVQVEEDVT